MKSLEITQFQNDLEEIKNKFGKKLDAKKVQLSLEKPRYPDRFKRLLERNYQVSCRIMSELIPVSCGMSETIQKWTDAEQQDKDVMHLRSQLDNFKASAVYLTNYTDQKLLVTKDLREANLDQLMAEYKSHRASISRLEKLYGILGDIDQLENQAKNQLTNARSRHQHRRQPEFESKLDSLRRKLELAIADTLDQGLSTEPVVKLRRSSFKLKNILIDPDAADDANLLLNILMILLMVFLSFGFYYIFKYYLGFSKPK